MSNVLIGQGHVYHTRKEGAKNSFRYPTFFVQLQCDHEQELQHTLKNSFRGLLSLSAKDYLKGDDGSFSENIRSFLKDSCDYEAEEVCLHTLPKMFGYAFNPVSFWLCKRAGQLEAVLVEVNNTFGEKHFYWVKPQTPILSTEWFKATKVFHVSPFFPVEGYYQFRFQTEAPVSRIDINYHSPEGTLRLATWIQGNLTPLSSVGLATLLRRYGWITPMVVLRIHFQALRLFFKKSRFYSKPPLPEKKVTS